MSSDFSSDDDDESSYVNAAARLKALKARPPPPKQIKDKSPERFVEASAFPSSTPEESIPASDEPRHPEWICRSRRQTKDRRAVNLAVNNRVNGVQNAAPVTVNMWVPQPPIVIPDDDDSPSLNNRSISLLDSDTDQADVSIDSDYVIEVKIRWQSTTIERIKLGKKEKFEKVFQHFAAMKNVLEKQITIMKGDRSVNYHDTPASLNLGIIDILEAGIVDVDVADDTEENLEDMCRIKIQFSSSTREQLTFNLHKTDTFSKLIEFCAREKKVPMQKIKCFFDGELVSPSDTPETLDLDDEACIDLRILS